MKNYTQIIRFILASLALSSALALCGPVAVAQDAEKTSDAVSAKQRKVTGGRDPFSKYKPPAPQKKSAPTVMTPPSIQERIALYKQQKWAAMNALRPAPKPTTALLLGEIQVVGIFRTPRGYAAMVEATPIKLSYVVYPGETFFDGQLVAIEENRLVFRREVRWTDGRRETTVVTSPLRQANAVTDSMTAVKGAGGSGPDTSAVKSGGEKSAPEKQ